MSKSPTHPRAVPFLLALLIALLPASAAQQRRQTRPAPARPTTGVPPARTTQPDGAPSRQATPNDAAEDETTFDTLVAAESYAIYFEARRVGQIVRSKELADLLESFVAQSGPPKELTDTLDFFKAHAESLENANLHIVAMPTRAGLPRSIGALQLPSVEEAKRVEPALRGLVGKYEAANVAAKEAQKAAVENAEKAIIASGSSARRGSTETVKVEAKKAKAKPAAPVFHFKRVGRLLLLSDAQLAARTLRAARRRPLFSSQRLQAARARLASEQVFVFVDLNLLQKGASVEGEARMERMRQEEAAHAAHPPEAMTEIVRPREEVNYASEEEILAEIAATAEAEGPPPPAPDPPSPVIEPTIEADGMNEGSGTPQAGGATAPPGDEMTVRRADMLVSSLFGMALGGMPVWPEAFGVGASLGGDDVTLRALIINGAANETRIIPFLPLLTSGHEIVPGASSVAPEDSEVFVSFSLDWQKLYTQLLGAASRQQAEMEEARHRIGEPGTTPENAEQETPEKTIEALEKLFGFKIKEDLLPALGDEVAISSPLDWFEGPSLMRGRRAEAKGADAATPGFVLFVSLRNADTVRRILPRLLEAAGMKTLGAASQTERRAGVEIVNHGGVSSAFLGNYLALATRPEPLRHIADSLARQGVLASHENFRAAVDWQPRQSLAQVYVSRGLMEAWLKQMRQWADPNDAEFQALIARHDVSPRPAAYSVTHDGGGDLFHELHLPVGLIELFASSDTIQRARANPVRAHETTAIRHLYALADAQEAYREREGKGSYGTLEQLVAGDEQGSLDVKEGVWRPKGYFSRQVLEKMEYRLSITASGDKYTVLATPKEYGKSGRRSFYLDETGVVRGADHAGQPANASDPPVDE